VKALSADAQQQEVAGVDMSTERVGYLCSFIEGILERGMLPRGMDSTIQLSAAFPVAAGLLPGSPSTCEKTHMQTPSCSSAANSWEGKLAAAQGGQEPSPPRKSQFSVASLIGMVPSSTPMLGAACAGTMPDMAASTTVSTTVRSISQCGISVTAKVEGATGREGSEEQESRELLPGLYNLLDLKLQYAHLAQLLRDAKQESPADSHDFTMTSTRQTTSCPGSQVAAIADGRLAAAMTARLKAVSHTRRVVRFQVPCCLFLLLA
jgi:hypothetical protein